MPRPTTLSKTTRLLAACLLGAACSAPAFAQNARNPGQGAAPGEQMRPPRVGSVEKASTLLYYAVGIGALALCVGVVVVPGRREQNE